LLGTSSVFVSQATTSCFAGGIVPHETSVDYCVNRSGFAALRLRLCTSRSPLRRLTLA